MLLHRRRINEYLTYVKEILCYYWLNIVTDNEVMNKSNELKKILPWENQRVNIAPDITVTNE